MNCYAFGISSVGYLRILFAIVILMNVDHVSAIEPCLLSSNQFVYYYTGQRGNVPADNALLQHHT